MISSRRKMNIEVRKHLSEYAPYDGHDKRRFRAIDKAMALMKDEYVIVDCDICHVPCRRFDYRIFHFVDGKHICSDCYSKRRL